MLANFYVTVPAPYAYYEDIQAVLKNWSIKVAAIDGMAIESIVEMPERERIATFATRQDAAFLFKVESCLDLGAAQGAVDDMLLEVSERTYEEKVAQHEDAMDRADEFAEQFTE